MGYYTLSDFRKQWDLSVALSLYRDLRTAASFIMILAVEARPGTQDPTQPSSLSEPDFSVLGCRARKAVFKMREVWKAWESHGWGHWRRIFNCSTQKAPGIGGLFTSFS